MNIKEVEKLLSDVRDGKRSVNDALEILKNFPYSDLGFAKIDHHREIRTGYPEIVYCAGKTVAQNEAFYAVGFKTLGADCGNRFYIGIGCQKFSHCSSKQV
jgi:NCAIR mutase (PurE)-related protein